MKVEVIGIGVAGSFASWKIAERGQEVTAYDLKKEVMPARCGELIRLPYLKQVGIKPKKEFIDSEVNKVVLGLIEKKGINLFDFKSINPYAVLNRQNFEKFLIKKAVDAGAKLNFGIAKRGFSKKAEFKIGAWGVFPINKKYLIDEISFGYQFLLKGVEVKKQITFVFSNEKGVKYYWIFPKGNGRANVGVMLDAYSSNLADKKLKDFIKLNENLKKGEVVRKVAKSISSSIPFKKEEINDEKLALIGDAGRFCDALTGAGINSALITAKNISEVIGEERPLDLFFEKSSTLIKKLNDSYFYSKKFYYEEQDKVGRLRKKMMQKENVETISKAIKSIYN